MSERSDKRAGEPWSGDDALLAALRALPALDIAEAEGARIAARAARELRAGLARRARFTRLAAVWLRPLVPLSLAAFLLSYLAAAVSALAALHR